MKLKDMNLKDTFYTHQNKLTKEATTINITAMNNVLRQLLIANKEQLEAAGVIRALVPIQKDTADYIRENSGIEKHRLDRITPEIINDSVLSVIHWSDDDTHTIVDGNHRYVKANEFGITEMRAFICSEKFWRKFVIEDFPNDPAFVEKFLLTGYSGIP